MTRYPRELSFVVAAAAALAAMTLAAQPASEFQVNVETGGHQQRPIVGAGANGSFVVVWQDQSFPTDTSFSAIAARRFTADGTPLATPFRVNTYTTGSQTFPSIAVEPAGSFIVVWSSDGDGDGSGIYGQRYAAGGVPLGVEFRVNSGTTGSQGDASVGIDSTGRFVVLWSSYDGLFAQRYSAGGSPLGDELRVSDASLDFQNAPGVAFDASGNFTVVWRDMRSGDGDVWARRYAVAGAPLGTELRVNTTLGGDQQMPHAAGDADGDVVVVWTDGADVFGRRFSSSGAASGGEFRVNASTTGIQTEPSVGMAPDGTFVVAWREESASTTGRDVFARRFSNTGAPLGNDFRVNLYTTSDQVLPALSVDANGAVHAVWQSLGQDGHLNGVFGGSFALGVSGPGVEFLVNHHTTGAQREPSVAPLAGGAWVAVWQGQDGPYELRGRRFAPGAVPALVEFRVSTATTAIPRAPVAASNGADRFVVAWAESDPYSVTHILARRFEGSGNALSSPFRVNLFRPFPEPGAGVAMMPTGEFMIVWDSASTNIYDSGVWARGFNSTGGGGGDFRVSTVATGTEGDASVAADSTGTFLVVWRSNVTPRSIKGRRYKMGEGLGEEFQISTMRADSVEEPSAAFAADGAAVVVWRSRTGNSSGVHARRYASSGAPVGDEFLVSAASSALQGQPRIASDGARFLVTWIDDVRFNAPSASALARWLDGSGAPAGPAFRVNSNPTVAYDPAVGALEDSFVLLWAEPRGSASDVRGVLVCTSGDANGDTAVDVADVFALINFLFAAGTPLAPCTDPNSDGSVTVTDVFFLINHLFAGGPAPL